MRESSAPVNENKSKGYSNRVRILKRNPSERKISTGSEFFFRREGGWWIGRDRDWRGIRDENRVMTRNWKVNEEMQECKCKLIITRATKIGNALQAGPGPDLKYSRNLESFPFRRNELYYHENTFFIRDSKTRALILNTDPSYIRVYRLRLWSGLSRDWELWEGQSYDTLL